MSSPTERLGGANPIEPESAPEPVVVAPVPAGPLPPAPDPAPPGVEDAASPGAETAGAEPEWSHPLVQDLLLNPTRWRIWPAVALLRWLQRRTGRQGLRLVYRSQPSLSFVGSEVNDVGMREDCLELTLNSPGLATAGSSLPAADIARIIADQREGGGLSAWLDGPGDLYMQVLEAMQAQSNTAFALMIGGRISAHDFAADIVGRTATLAAGPGGALYDCRGYEPEGAVGLAGLFLGPITASGLGELFRAFTGLPVRVEEFAGAEVTTARPARVGRPMGMMLGATCRLPSAGVEVHIEGGSEPRSQEWARDPVRRWSLHLLALSYVGVPSPVVRLFLWLDAENAPPAALDGSAAFGGLVLLGEAGLPVKFPLEV